MRKKYLKKHLKTVKDICSLIKSAGVSNNYLKGAKENSANSGWQLCRGSPYLENLNEFRKYYQRNTF